MWDKRHLLALAAGAAMAMTTSTSAQASVLNSADAEQIRKLEIMLMVSSLRCRSSSTNFQPEYHAFSRRHVATLKAASVRLREDLSRRHGPKGAKRALDRISVSMANRYGGGHPWMDCADLKDMTVQLGKPAARSQLVAAAAYLLADSDRGNFVLASAH